MISEYHPNTVRASSVPLYMQGFPRLGEFGQDDGIDIGTGMEDTSSILIDPSSLDILPAMQLLPGGPTGISFEESPLSTSLTFNPSTPQLTPSQIDIANLYQSAVASGTITAAQAASQIKAAISTVKPALGPGAAPRVATPAVPGAASILTSQSIIKGIPDIALIGSALLLFAGLEMRNR
jgi:hypothetical protein